MGIGLQHSAQNHDPDVYSSDESLEELSSLAQSAGLQVVGFLQQSLDKPDAQTFLGSGKVLELLEVVAKTDARALPSAASALMLRRPQWRLHLRRLG